MSKKGEKYGLMVLAVVAVVAAAGLVMNLTGLTGAWGWSMPKFSVCSDRFGVTYTSRDYVTKSSANTYDTCLDSSRLSEAICQFNNIGFTTYDCRIQGKVCQNGACVNPPAPVCGNGKVEVGEGCEDGNFVNGDGCDSTCQFEPGKCAINLDCGITHVEGPVYCDGNTVKQDLRIYACYQNGKPYQNPAAPPPGSVCLNNKQPITIHTCPEGTQCQPGTGTCIRSCQTDADCTSIKFVEDPWNRYISCQNNFCIPQTSGWRVCHDGDNTNVNLPSSLLISPNTDFSPMIPAIKLCFGYDVSIDGTPPKFVFYYIQDFCDITSATPPTFTIGPDLWEQNTARDLKIDCLQLTGKPCQLFHTSKTNSYLPNNIQVGFCPIS